jgi:hypothetical protein
MVTERSSDNGYKTKPVALHSELVVYVCGVKMCAFGRTVSE